MLVFLLQTTMLSVLLGVDSTKPVCFQHWAAFELKLILLAQTKKISEVKKNNNKTALNYLFKMLINHSKKIL